MGRGTHVLLTCFALIVTVSAVDFVNIYGTWPTDPTTQQIRDKYGYKGNGILQSQFGFSKSPISTDVHYTENNSDQIVRGWRDDCSDSCGDNPICVTYNFYIWTVHAEPTKLAEGGDGVGFGGAVLFDYFKDYFPVKAICEQWDTVPILPIDESNIWPIISSQVWIKPEHLLESYGSAN